MDPAGEHPGEAPHAHERHEYRKARTVEDVTSRNVQAMRRLEELALKQRSFADRERGFASRSSSPARIASSDAAS